MNMHFQCNLTRSLILAFAELLLDDNGKYSIGTFGKLEGQSSKFYGLQH